MKRKYIIPALEVWDLEAEEALLKASPKIVLSSDPEDEWDEDNDIQY